MVADESGDPFIFARSLGVILHAYHGEGEWDASEMFPDLNTMAACLAEIGAIVHEAGRSYTDKDCFISTKDRALAPEILRLGFNCFHECGGNRMHQTILVLLAAALANPGVVRLMP